MGLFVEVRESPFDLNVTARCLARSYYNSWFVKLCLRVMHLRNNLVIYVNDRPKVFHAVSATETCYFSFQESIIFQGLKLCLWASILTQTKIMWWALIRIAIDAYLMCCCAPSLNIKPRDHDAITSSSSSVSLSEIRITPEGVCWTVLRMECDGFTLTSFFLRFLKNQ